MREPDDQLVQQYLDRGDQDAFRRLVERHQEPVYSFLLGMVRDRNVADDLFQDTFIRVLDALGRRRGSYAQQGKFLAWVMRIARNATLDYFRSRSKWQDTSGSDGFWDRLTSEAPAPDEVLVTKERRAWLDLCIARLPAEQREVLVLRQDSELTFREIAELTGVSINTALGRMRYALINLRRMTEQRSAAKKKTAASAVAA